MIRAKRGFFAVPGHFCSALSTVRPSVRIHSNFDRARQWPFYPVPFVATAGAAIFSEATATVESLPRPLMVALATTTVLLLALSAVFRSRHVGAYATLCIALTILDWPIVGVLMAAIPASAALAPSSRSRRSTRRAAARRDGHPPPVGGARAGPRGVALVVRDDLRLPLRRTARGLPASVRRHGRPPRRQLPRTACPSPRTCRRRSAVALRRERAALHGTRRLRRARTAGAARHRGVLAGRDLGRGALHGRRLRLLLAEPAAQRRHPYQCADLPHASDDRGVGVRHVR